MAVNGIRMNMLIISTFHDFATYHSSHIAEQLKDLVDNIDGLYVRHIRGFLANSFVVTNALKHGRWDLIVYFGHGEHDQWSNLIDIHNAGLFKGAIVVAMSCSSMKELGVASIEHGAIAYIGNDQELWGALPEKIMNNAIYFARVWQEIVINLLRGHDVRSTVTISRGRWFQLYQFYTSTGNHEYAERALINYNGHGFVGDGGASLSPALLTNTDKQLDWNAIAGVTP